ncbi:hypothetical protein MGYG_01622 [Nannizzia gypsea CBS 118893]|uniref:BTB domain-containing protein n=1 Tax=Arthroderma gypseum (strain ATCC MYA-4604 / CBS 118893) TaxID=535722 RepID=E5R234_ARTGP|nr:hypothetical protein MGYG_01622 [Nannizzia gypsea CBS 118893]EFQ98598.1 hypothetical protein MGYG_01622 [Nannizzia gypsea CBS 118893]
MEPSTAASRGPSSVTSSRRSRRHRFASRSHAGGSSHQQLNEFPVFSTTGDVEIVIRAADQERRYLLHRLILAQNSGFFEASTSDEWSSAQAQREINAALTTGTSNWSAGDVLSHTGLEVTHECDEEDDDNGATRTSTEPRRTLTHRTGIPPAKTKWRYELDWENREGDEVPILVQKPPSSSKSVFGPTPQQIHPPLPTRSKPVPPQQGFFRSMANLTGIQSALHLPLATHSEESLPVDPTIRDYDNLFRIFYNYAPQLNPHNITIAYSQCKSLIALADMYDALTVTGPRVDYHLLRFSSSLYKHIAKFPASYIKLGYQARSRVIFTEALIHIVGDWPVSQPLVGRDHKSPLPEAVLDLIEDKVEDLKDEIRRAESKLFRLTLTTSRGERVTPFNGYLDWLAVSLFRQWLVDNTTPPPPTILKFPAPPTSSQRDGRTANPSAPARNVSTAGGSNSSGSRQHNPSNSTSSRRVASNTSATRPSTSRPSTARPSTGNSAANRNDADTNTKPQAPFCIGRTYRLIGSSNLQAYLNHDEIKRFLKLHPTSYSRENLKRLEGKIDELKRLAREIVKPLMRNFLELDLKSSSGDGDTSAPWPGVTYLTCTRIEEADLPWY